MKIAIVIIAIVLARLFMYLLVESTSRMKLA